jgi:hypothetical protein
MMDEEDPASQPLVTSVGGTTLFTGPKEVSSTEEVWNLLGSHDGATGGGVSSYWALPSYQLVGITLTGINPPTSNAPLPTPPPIAWIPPLNPVAIGNGGSSTNRNARLSSFSCIFDSCKLALTSTRSRPQTTRRRLRPRRVVRSDFGLRVC